MKVLVFLILTVVEINGDNGNYSETNFKESQTQRYNSRFLKRNRHYRDALPPAYVEKETKIWNKPPFPVEEITFKDKSSYFPNEQPVTKNQRWNYMYEGPPPYIQPEIIYQAPSLPFKENVEQLRNHRKPFIKNHQFDHNFQEPTPLFKSSRDIFYGKSPSLFNVNGQQKEPEYAKPFGIHESKYASISITSASPDLNALPTITTVAPFIQSLNVHLNEQSVDYKIPFPKQKFEAVNTFVKNKASIRLSKPNIGTTDYSVNIPMTRPLIPSSNVSSGSKQVYSNAATATSSIQNIHEYKETDAHSNHQLEKSKGRLSSQQSASPEMSSYMLSYQQMNAPAKLTLHTSPISSLSAGFTPLEAIKYIPWSSPNLILINHDSIHPQTPLSPVALSGSEFMQNSLDLEQIEHLDTQKQDVSPGLYLGLAGFAGIGGIDYGAQTSNSISRPAVWVSQK